MKRKFGLFIDDSTDRPELVRNESQLVWWNDDTNEFVSIKFDNAERLEKAAQLFNAKENTQGS